MTRLRAVLDPPPTGRRPPPGSAAVLVAADPAAPGLPLLFIRRTRRVPAHRGQVAFPGGGVVGSDPDWVATALREAREEVGLDPADVEVIGTLGAVHTATSRRRVVPVVGLLRRPFAPRADGYEVAEWFWVPVVDLLQAPVTVRAVPGAGAAVVRFYEVGGRVIWGATAEMIADLLARLESSAGPSPS